MPHSADNRQSDATPGRNLAVAAESLYVINLLLFPFVAFAALLTIYLRHRDSAPPLARAHLQQTLGASLWIAVMFVIATGTILLMRAQGVEDVTLWMIVVFLFTIVHASMVLLGVVGLAKAMAGKCWRYPLFGKALPPGCAE